jgi:hypothetical protein
LIVKLFKEKDEKVYEKEVERYGNRTVAGFLKMAGAEMPMQSDQVIWSEQGRLHIAYQATIATTTGTISAIKDIDNTGGADIAHSLRVGNTVVCDIGGVVFKAFVKSALVMNFSSTPPSRRSIWYVTISFISFGRLCYWVFTFSFVIW